MQSLSVLTLAILGAANAKNINDCGDSTFNNKSSGGSPKISDCQQIARNIAGGGSWTIPCAGRQQHTYATFGTCAVGAHCSIGGANIAHIGNSDTIDIINSSIQRFAYRGLVGADGEMNCQDSLKEDAYCRLGYLPYLRPSYSYYDAIGSSQDY